MGRIIPLPSAYAPDDVADVVCHKQRAALVDRYSDRTTHRLVVAADKALEDILRPATWAADPPSISWGVQSFGPARLAHHKQGWEVPPLH